MAPGASASSSRKKKSGKGARGGGGALRAHPGMGDFPVDRTAPSGGHMDPQTLAAVIAAPATGPSLFEMFNPGVGGGVRNALGQHAGLGIGGVPLGGDPLGGGAVGGDDDEWDEAEDAVGDGLPGPPDPRVLELLRAMTAAGAAGQSDAFLEGHRDELRTMFGPKHPVVEPYKPKVSLPKDAKDIYLSWTIDTFHEYWGARPLIQECEGKLYANYEKKDHIGTIKCLKINPGLALNEDYDIVDVCDAHSQEAYEIATRYRDEEGGQVGDGMEVCTGAIVLIDRIHVVKAWRGTGVGLWLADQAIHGLNDGMSLTVIQPGPVDDNMAPDARMSDTAHKRACKRLEKHYQRLGFKKWGQGYFALWNGAVTPRINDLCPHLCA